MTWSKRGNSKSATWIRPARVSRATQMGLRPKACAVIARAPTARRVRSANLARRVSAAAPAESNSRRNACSLPEGHGPCRASMWWPLATTRLRRAAKCRWPRMGRHAAISVLRRASNRLDAELARRRMHSHDVHRIDAAGSEERTRRRGFEVIQLTYTGAHRPLALSAFR